MIKVGIVGVGFMGWIHHLAYQRVEGIELGAICSRDEKKRSGDWTGIQGNFGPPGEKIDMANVSAFSNIEELLADESIDLVDVCLPPNLHLEVGLRVLNAGKHLFCEKPLALNAADCNQLVAAAAESGKQLLVGQVLPFFPDYTVAREEIESGKHGKLIGGNFKRIISDPSWLADFWDLEKVGGPLVDLHVHDAHLIRMLFGMPKAVFSHGRMRDGVVEFCNSNFFFDDPSVVVGSTSGVINQQGRPFTHGFEIHLEKATMQFEFAAFDDNAESMPLKILGQKGEEVIRPELPGGDEIAGFEAEISEVVKAIQTNESSPILSGELAKDAIILCQKQAESVESRKLVEV